MGLDGLEIDSPHVDNVPTMESSQPSVPPPQIQLLRASHRLAKLEELPPYNADKEAHSADRETIGMVASWLSGWEGSREAVGELFPRNLDDSIGLGNYPPHNQQEQDRYLREITFGRGNRFSQAENKVEKALTGGVPVRNNFRIESPVLTECINRGWPPAALSLISKALAHTYAREAVDVAQRQYSKNTGPEIDSLEKTNARRRNDIQKLEEDVRKKDISISSAQNEIQKLKGSEVECQQSVEAKHRTLADSIRSARRKMYDNTPPQQLPLTGRVLLNSYIGSSGLGRIFGRKRVEKTDDQMQEDFKRELSEVAVSSPAITTEDVELMSMYYMEKAHKLIDQSAEDLPLEQRVQILEEQRLPVVMESLGIQWRKVKNRPQSEYPGLIARALLLGDIGSYNATQREGNLSKSMTLTSESPSDVDSKLVLAIAAKTSIERLNTSAERQQLQGNVKQEISRHERSIEAARAERDTFRSRLSELRAEAAKPENDPDVRRRRFVGMKAFDLLGIPLESTDDVSEDRILDFLTERMHSSEAYADGLVRVFKALPPSISPETTPDIYKINQERDNLQHLIASAVEKESFGGDKSRLIAYGLRQRAKPVYDQMDVPGIYSASSSPIPWRVLVDPATLVLDTEGRLRGVANLSDFEGSMFGDLNQKASILGSPPGSQEYEALMQEILTNEFRGERAEQLGMSSSFVVDAGRGYSYQIPARERIMHTLTKLLHPSVRDGSHRFVISVPWQR